MKYIEKVGNIDVYAEQNGNETTIFLFNGSDDVAHETYNGTIEKAVEDLFRKKFDVYTEEWLYLNGSTKLEKLTANTYKDGVTDWFCRIDGTKYFKHFHKTVEEFTKNKNGKRIIDL